MARKTRTQANKVAAILSTLISSDFSPFPANRATSSSIANDYASSFGRAIKSWAGYIRAATRKTMRASTKTLALLGVRK